MKQRSKEELIRQYKLYEATRKDAQKDEDERASGGCSYWRTSVEWIYALWITKHLRKNDLVKIINYVQDNFESLDEEKKENIRNKMDSKRWILKNNVKPTRRRRDIVGQNWLNFEYYNTEVSTNYSLLVIEWLIDNKGFSSNEIDDLLTIVSKTDKFGADTIYSMRNDIFKVKGIWLELNKGDTKAHFKNDNRK